MEEVIGILAGIVKGIGLLFRACLESGILEVSIRKPGKFLLKIIWPPFWSKPIEYNGFFLTVLGIIFWGLMAYAYYYIFKISGL